MGQEELDARSVNVRNRDDVGTKAKGEMVPHPGHDNTASNTYKTYRKKSSLSGLKFTIRRQLEASSFMALCSESPGQGELQNNFKMPRKCSSKPPHRVMQRP